jgi:hypothetical protein
MDPAAADAALQNLKAMFVRMPDLNLSPQARATLSRWAQQQAFSGK